MFKSPLSRSLCRPLLFAQAACVAPAFTTLLLFLVISAGLSDSAQAATTLRIATAAPGNHPINQALTDFAAEVTSVTKGAVQVKAYPRAVLGSEPDTIRQVANAELDGVVILGMITFESLDKRFQVEDLPFLFRSREHAYAAVDGAYGSRVRELLREQGLYLVSFWENGFRQFTNNRHPIKTPKDLNGLKMRIAASPIRIQMFKNMGAAGIPMAFGEVYAALQQGVIDGQENPISVIAAAKLNEVQKYLTLSNHIWSSAELVLNLKQWNRLSAKEQEIVKQVAEKYKYIVRAAVQEQDKELLEQLRSAGMQINTIDLPAFHEQTNGLLDRYRQQHGDELLQLIEAAN